MGPSKSPDAQEYWRSKVNTPRVDPAPSDAAFAEAQRRAAGLATIRLVVLLVCTFALCATAVAVALIVT